MRILHSTEEGVHQHPCLEVAHHPLRLVPGHRQRSLLRGHPAPLEKLVGYLLQQVLPGEGIGHHLQQLHRQKLVIPRHPSSQTVQEKVVFLSLQGELQVKVKIRHIKNSLFILHLATKCPVSCCCPSPFKVWSSWVKFVCVIMFVNLLITFSFLL